MSQPWSDAIRTAVDEATPYSFGDPQRIIEWAEVFVEAHHMAPGGLSLEIGTWRGGTAYVFLKLLERLYPAATRPMLFTVDPYGDKPYNGGDATARPALYGDADYVIMKKLLARFPNHAHFYMTSEEFFRIVHSYKQSPLSYWWSNREHRVENVAFALIDGEHDAETIGSDVDDAWRVLAPDGVLVVDNIDNDPKTLGRLSDLHGFLLVHEAALARVDGARQQYAVIQQPLCSQRVACR